MESGSEMQIEIAEAGVSEQSSRSSNTNEPESMEEQAIERSELAERTADNEIMEERGLKTKLECLKAIVECIRGNINRNAVIPQKAIAFNGTTTGEKIKNLAEKAIENLKSM